MIIFIKPHEEEWKDIIEYNVKNIYEISNYGKVRNKLTGRFLSPFTDKDGYLRCTLKGYKKQRKFYIHRLVGYYFLPLKVFFNEKYIHINHKDTNKTNNFYKNLEWSTPKENIDHSWREGLQKPVKGERHGCNKYSETLIRGICILLEKGYSEYEIRKEMNMIVKDKKQNESYRGLVKHLRKRTSWVHISKDYTY